MAVGSADAAASVWQHAHRPMAAMVPIADSVTPT